MGCRLHWGKTYQIEWEGGWFNWNAEVIKAILRYLEIDIWECSYEDTDYGDFEMTLDNFLKLKKVVKDARSLPSYEEPIMTVEELRENGVFVDSDQEIYCPSYKNLDEWVEEVDKSYDRHNSYIHFTWF